MCDSRLLGQCSGCWLRCWPKYILSCSDFPGVCLPGSNVGKMDEFWSVLHCGVPSASYQLDHCLCCLRFFILCTQHELNKQQCHTISSPFDLRHSASSPDEAPATDAHIRLEPLPLLLMEPLPLLLLELADRVLERSNQLLLLGLPGCGDQCDAGSSSHRSGSIAVLPCSSSSSRQTFG